ncbi:MAG: hypothetical protein ACTHKG_04395 [Nocardioides sp.]
MHDSSKTALRPSTRLGPRAAGIALLAYVVATVAAMANTGPGGDFEPASVTAWTSEAHRWGAFGVGYLGCFAALGLLVFTLGSHHRVHGPTAEVYRSLGVIGAGIAMVGWWLSAGIAVALTEGGPDVRAGMSQPVVDSLSEMANLLAVCAPALCLGVMGWILADRGQQPRWLRILGAVGGTGGVLAAFYFVIPLYLVWLVVLGLWTVRSSRPAREASPVSGLEGHAAAPVR